MRVEIFLLLMAGLIISTNSLNAQHHYNAWLRGTLVFPITQKIRTDIEVQYRRQNGFENKNMFDENLMLSSRIWISYQHNDWIRFSVSPFAFFSNYKIIQYAAEENTDPISEIRFSAAVDLQPKIFNKFYFIDRSAIEFRNFGENLQDITRFRNRFGFRYEFTKKTEFTIFDEILFNVGGISPEHIFDHNRIAFILGNKIVQGLKIELGYIYISRLPLKSNSRLYENNFIMNLAFQIKS